MKRKIYCDKERIKAHNMRIKLATDTAAYPLSDRQDSAPPHLTFRCKKSICRAQLLELIYATLQTRSGLYGSILA
jgi:hypothetical protein